MGQARARQRISGLTGAIRGLFRRGYLCDDSFGGVGAIWHDDLCRGAGQAFASIIGGAYLDLNRAAALKAADRGFRIGGGDGMLVVIVVRFFPSECPRPGSPAPQRFNGLRRVVGRGLLFFLALGRVMVVATYNSDLGDAWEYMDAACYPVKYSGQAYRLGMNFMVYAMTH